MIVEYRTNLALLAADEDIHQKALAATGKRLAMTGPQPQLPGDTTELGRILADCLTNPTFNPAQGATESLIASGDLRLIGDTRLQGTLTQWHATAGYVRDWQEIERHHGEELILGLTYGFVAWPDVTFAMGASAAPSAFESDYRALLASRRFEGLLTNRQWNLRDIITGIGDLEAATTQLIARLETRRKLL